MIALPDKLFLPEMSLAVSAALTGGERIMDVYRSEFSHTFKDGKEPITEADLASNEAIRQTLSSSGWPILSEESADGKERLASSRVWIVDPLDGTSDFVNRTGEFSIMIALVEAGEPILGVVFRPLDKTLYLGQKGAGAYKSKHGAWLELRVSAKSDLRKARTVVSRHHLSEQEKSFLEKMQINSFAQKGSSGLKIAAVAEGEADLYFTFSDKIKHWDTAAGYAIIKEAGGEITDMLGKKLTYNTADVYHKNGILAGNKFIHAAVAGLATAANG